MNLFETFDYWQWSTLIKIYIGTEQVKSLILINKVFYSCTVAWMKSTIQETTHR
jgi:hypothetical protein